MRNNRQNKTKVAVNGESVQNFLSESPTDAFVSAIAGKIDKSIFNKGVKTL